MTKEITIIEKEISPITTKADALEIHNNKTMTEAVQLLTSLNQSLDKITKEKEKVTKPLNEALKAERARWKPIESTLEEAIATTREKMSDYQTEQARIAREQEERIAARLSKGTLKVETAIKKLNNIETPDDKITTEDGMVKFRTVQTLKITDESLIPREYMVIDESAVLKALKANLSVPGAFLEEKQVPVNYR